MQLFHFDAVTSKISRVDFNSNTIKLDDMVNGSYVIKFENDLCPIYFAGYDSALVNYLMAKGKPFLSMQSFLTSVFVAALSKGTEIKHTELTTAHDLNLIIKELMK